MSAPITPPGVPHLHPLTGLPLDPFAPDTDSPFGVAPLGAELSAIEASVTSAPDFWNASPQLKLIAQVADQRGVARWGVLGAVINNLLSWLPPHFVLPDRYGNHGSLGDAGSLNFFTHIIGESNDGKSLITGVADLLMPPNVGGANDLTGDPEPDALTSGTGEGLMKHFVHQGSLKETEDGPSKKGMIQTSDTAVLTIDEVSTYVSELTRQGSKSAGIQVSLWSGASAGTNTSTADNRTKVPKHAVRLVILLLGQYGHVAELFTDHQIDLGAPHRPLWLPAVSWGHAPVQPGAARLLRSPVDSWALAQYRDKNFGAGKSIFRKSDFPKFVSSPADADLYWVHPPQAARDYINNERQRRQLRTLTPADYVTMSPEEAQARRAEKLTGHATLTRLKVMTGLALLHERFQPSDLDWELSGVASRVSLGMLAACHVQAKRTRTEVARNKGADRAEELDATNLSLDAKKERRLDDLKWDTLRRLNTEGPKTQTELDRKMGTTKRAELKVVLERLVQEGLAVRDADTSRYHVIYNGIGAAG